MQLLGSQTISGALGLKGSAVAGSGNATGVLLVQSTLPGQRQIATQQVSASQTGDLFTALDYNSNTMMKIDQNGQIRSYGIGQQILPLGTPVITLVTNNGTAGSTTYAYRVGALNSQGATVASSEVTTTTGNATLDVTNNNTITWNPVGGATTYRIYGRYAGAEALLATIAGDGRGGTYSYIDQTVAGSQTTSGVNPIPNSSLPVNTSTWAAVGGTFVRDQTHSYPSTLSGLSTGLFTSTVSTGTATLETSSPGSASRQMPTVTPGASYSASIYAWLGTMPSVTVGINWYDTTQTFLSQSLGSASTTAGSWNRITALNITAPAGAVYATVAIAFGETAIGQTAWVTAPQIDPGATSAGYVYDIPQAGAGTGLVIQQWNSATGPMTTWQQYGGSTLAAVGSAGQFIPSVGSVGYVSTANYFGSALANSPVLRIEGYGNGTGGAGSLISISNRNITGTPVQVALGGGTGILATPQTTANVAAVFRGLTSQIANIQEWQDPTGATTYSYVDNSGRAFFPTLFTQSVKDPSTLIGALNMNTAGYVLDVTAGTGSAQRVTQRLKLTAAQTADSFQLQESTGNAVLARMGASGQMAVPGLATVQAQLSTPVITGIVTAGTAGATTYTYRVSAFNAAGGETPASAEVAITTGNSSLSGTNYNTLAWSAVTGATGYRVYGRYAGAEALLATLGAVTTYNDQSNTTGAAVAAGLNPIPNSSMNVNTTGWQVTGCTIARDVTFTPPVPGVTAALFTSTVASGGCNTQTGNQLGAVTRVGVSASTLYTASAWVYLGTMPSASIGVQWFDSGGSFISGAVSGLVGVTTGWTRITVTGTSASAAAYANIYIQGNTTAIGQTMWFAAPQIDLTGAAMSYQLDLPRGVGMLYEGNARVYSPNNPPPGSSSITQFQVSSTGPVPLTLASPWANNGGANPNAAYFRNAEGWVQLTGLIFPSSAVAAAGNIATGAPAPADANNHSFSIVDFAGTAHVIGIGPTGTLYVIEGTVATNSALPLDGISYYVGGSTSFYVAGPGLQIPSATGHAVTLASGWTDYNATVSTYAPVRWNQTPDGTVYLSGLALASSTYGAGSTIIPAGQLPLPADGKAHVFAAPLNGATAGTSVLLGADGSLSTTQGTFTANNNVVLDGMIYRGAIASTFGASAFATSVKFGSER